MRISKDQLNKKDIQLSCTTLLDFIKDYCDSDLLKASEIMDLSVQMIRHFLSKKSFITPKVARRIEKNTKGKYNRFDLSPYLKDTRRRLQKLLDEL